ncbi:MAG: glutaredoxin family protein [Paucimonas sp.]|nr:glutaredoxin family protein [Paucimonas sp.]
MKTSRLLMPLLLLTAAGGAYAQMYKWVGPDGKVTYSDTPPPPSARKVETKLLIDNASIDTSNLPYELAEAVKNSPVTLYTTSKCPACDDGRKLLSNRGVPFVEKTVSTSEDIAQLKKAGGETHLPFLVVGRSKQQNFEPGAWNTTLTSAGYPESNRLPKNYHNPEAQSAAPKPADDATQRTGQKKKSEPEIRPEALPDPIGNAPPGFRF